MITFYQFPTMECFWILYLSAYRLGALGSLSLEKVASGHRRGVFSHVTCRSAPFRVTRSLFSSEALAFLLIVRLFPLPWDASVAYVLFCDPLHLRSVMDLMRSIRSFGLGSQKRFRIVFSIDALPAQARFRNCLAFQHRIVVHPHRASLHKVMMIMGVISFEVFMVSSYYFYPLLWSQCNI